MKKLFSKIVIGAMLLLASSSVSATTIQPFQGGTGISTTTAGNVGKFLQVSSSSPFLIYELSTPSGSASTTINGASGPTFTFNGSQNITISTSTNTVNFNTSQDISSTSTPTFGGITVSGTSTLGITKVQALEGIVAALEGILRTLTVLAPLSYSTTTNNLLISTSTASTDGFLTSTDWNTFNNKVPATRTLTAGNGLTGGGDLSSDRTFDVGAGTGITVNTNDVALTVPVSISNGGTGTTTGSVLSLTAGTGISVSSATGTPTITNTGVTSIVAGTNITVSNATGTVTVNSTATGGSASTTLQTVYKFDTGSYSSNATSLTEITTNWRATTTPIATTSKLILTATFCANTPDSEIRLLDFYDVTNATSVGSGVASGSRRAANIVHRRQGTDTNDAGLIVMQTIINSASTTARAYTIRVTTETSGSGTITFNQSSVDSGVFGWNTPFTFKIEEIPS